MYEINLGGSINSREAGPIPFVMILVISNEKLLRHWYAMIFILKIQEEKDVD
jgi:hypothetical protein